ncbi:Gfo/Idh/MocA family protein [Paenibacillus sp. R14(2021)]|uniref:Gfo/Idh/MocA family protein n=1 Tax=Paenibacillus sp. R14(2021) TaxID=2859228 RepID=UPI001C616242|nr:Gfo/Idh/MocA family oxidoreductase [Paenibacillus sp. R14(2021)]
MGKLKVGLIGTGEIAQVAHIPAYRKRSEEVEIVALVNRSREKAEEIAAQYGISNVFTSHKEMFEACELDAVSVCTPNRSHAAMVIDALHAGCHVLCEKPPALHASDAEAMAAAAARSGRMLAYNFSFRYSSEVEALKRYADAGELGHIYAARVEAMRRRGIPGWGSFTNKELQGGGPLIDIGIHMLDTALYLMDFPEPASVLAATHQQIGNRPGVGLMGSWDPEAFTVEDAAMGMIRFKNGASLLLETSFAINMREKQTMNVHLFGNQGGATVFPPAFFQEKHGSLVDLSLPFIVEHDKRQRAVDDFITCCLEGKTPRCTAEQGVQIMRLIDAFYQSAETGEAVYL